jgi:hypothetical protein
MYQSERNENNQPQKDQGNIGGQKGGQSWQTDKQKQGGASNKNNPGTSHDKDRSGQR